MKEKDGEKNMHIDDTVDADIRKRIQEIFNDKGTNPNKISTDIDIPQETLNRQINQDTKITADILRRIYKRYPDISLPWVLCGVGEKYMTPPLELTPQDDISEDNWKYIAKYATESSPFTIPLFYFADSINGYYKDEQSVGHLLLPHAREGDFAIVVTTDYMKPDYPSGCCIHLRKINKWHKFIKYGYPCLIELTDKKRILTILQQSVDPSQIRLVFTNENYPDMEMPVNNIKVVWEVVAKYQKCIL